MRRVSKLFLLAQSFSSALLGARAEAEHRSLSWGPANTLSGNGNVLRVSQGKGSTRTQTQDLMSSPQMVATDEFPLVEFYCF